MKLPGHKTKIVATIGPASESPETLERLIEAGMNVARLNFSHGSFEEHGARIRKLRGAAERVGRDVTILADLPGPKLRIGELEREPIVLPTGARFTLTTAPVVGNETRASCDFDELPRRVKPGDSIFLNDGMVELEVVEVSGGEVHTVVGVGGELRSRKGLNLPGLELGIPAFTDNDREALAFALEHGVDAVSQSFVETAKDVRDVRDAARELGAQPFIIAKIERAGALERIDEILEVADAIMVARGDLGVEVPVERIAVIQKDLIQKAMWRAKPVITATQMLESMTRSRRPTRAEATDVANAILDGTDCVMLSGESAVGAFPVESVSMLSRIAAVTEPRRQSWDLWHRLRDLTPDVELSIPDLLSLGVEAVMTCSKAAAIVTPTLGGTTARSMSRFRLPVWIAAICPDVAVCRHLGFSYGVVSLCRRAAETDWPEFTRKWVKEHGLEGSLAVLVQGPSKRHPEANFRLEMIGLEKER